jgi:hypothetical protein
MIRSSCRTSAACAPEVVIAPDVAAVAGAAVPIAIPPPSKLAVDPNIVDGAVPMVEHVVLLLGIAIVPVASPGAGLTPGDAISVEPRGMPVGETAEPVPMPSGEVAPMVGVGLAIPLICAMATLQRYQQWNDRGNQRESHKRSPFTRGAAAASAYVDQFRDEPAWCEAIGHRPIPP